LGNKIQLVSHETFFGRVGWFSKMKDLKILTAETNPVESNSTGCSKRGREIRFSG